MRHVLPLVFVILFCSCQAGKEFHYFKQGDNYYRLQVREMALLSTSRYQSGYYDESAVDNYFGEIKRPDSTGRVIPLSKVADPSKQQIPPGTKLVLVLSTNSEAVAGQISSLAENEQTLELIARLSNKDIQIENFRLKQTLKMLVGKDSSLKEFGTAMIEGVSDADKTAANVQNIRANLLAYINALAASTGKKTPFTTFLDAQKWFYETY
jgi:hypothetical protein